MKAATVASRVKPVGDNGQYKITANFLLDDYQKATKTDQHHMHIMTHINFSTITYPEFYMERKAHAGANYCKP
ncbi:hypothetical protein [Pseudocnuella soli]|uniref:hypothetical protein n=1 Tax=Pseudocnuella soli TaxID=2502779 RepID=UPI00104B5492|nr:hypothetical protein [Pseudocnuella soli]